ncbi:Histone-lysine N-methyltransferase TRX1 [Linum perenne]
MKGKQLETSRSDDGNKLGEGVVAEGKPEPGDLIWTKLSGRSWWPALVVEEDNPTMKNKRRGRSDRDVLVRLYGSSRNRHPTPLLGCRLYIDPMKYRSQFDAILQQNNGSCPEILWKTILKELPHLEPDSLKGSSSASKGKGGKAGSSKRKKSNHDKVKVDTTTSNDDVTASTKQKKTPQKKQRPEGQSAENDAGNRTPTQEQDGELTGRRVKVMQTLGLVPPSGSPF